VATSAIQRDGEVPTGDKGGASYALGPEHPQDVERGRPVNEHAAFLGGGRPEQTHPLLDVDHDVLSLRRRPMTRRSHAASHASAMVAVISSMSCALVFIFGGGAP
jgi:hypothetical protein